MTGLPEDHHWFWVATPPHQALGMQQGPSRLEDCPTARFVVVELLVRSGPYVPARLVGATSAAMPAAMVIPVPRGGSERNARAWWA
ncbi:MAG: hypothetical protein ABSE77_09140 [Acidimicrobiales bacterium]